MTELSTPKIFISYSWSSAEYGGRVVTLAEHLTADGVEVVLDRWHLREGQDKHHFMERAVNDAEINRVLILCDPDYVAKANDRRAGVGTETLIISPEIYRQVDQSKFIPVIMERDEAGKPVVPTYLEGRIYIDLSDQRTEDEEYQRLVRNIFGKPELKPPALGKPPAYLSESAIVLATGRSLADFKDAVRRGRPNQAGFLAEYLTRLAKAYGDEMIDPPKGLDELDERTVESIDHFLPYRDEFVDMIQFVGLYGEDPSLYNRLHAFFERVLGVRYQQRPTRWNGSLETENLGFIGWELFLYSVAALLRADRFHGISELLRPYYVESWQSGVGALRTFGVLDPGFQLLDDHRRRRLKIGWTSLSVKILRDRATHQELPFQALTEADTLLWLTTLVHPDLKTISQSGWYPRTLHFGENVQTLPLFVRAKSPSVFAGLALILGINTRDDLLARLKGIPEGQFPAVGNFWGGRSRFLEFLQLEP